MHSCNLSHQVQHLLQEFAITFDIRTILYLQAKTLSKGRDETKKLIYPLLHTVNQANREGTTRTLGARKGKQTPPNAKVRADRIGLHETPPEMHEPINVIVPGWPSLGRRGPAIWRFLIESQAESPWALPTGVQIPAPAPMKDLRLRRGRIARKCGGLEIHWARPTGVQIPVPAPSDSP